jgi:hypothetical protein
MFFIGVAIYILCLDIDTRWNYEYKDLGNINGISNINHDYSSSNNKILRGLLEKEINMQKGLAMAYPQYTEDITTLGTKWYYVWGACPNNSVPGCIPMSRNGDDPNLPLDYNDFVILFNEPNNPEPYGHPISPKDAVQIYMNLYGKYPQAKWVVGNVNIYIRRWMEDFWNICKTTPNCIMPKYIGWHIYISTETEAKHLHLFLDGIYQLNYPDTKWWITEFADITGNISNDRIMLDEFKKRDWIERWAYFTNRSNGDEPWYPVGWDVQLIDWNTGELTEIGKWYAEELHQVFLPIVQKGE